MCPVRRNSVPIRIASTTKRLLMKARAANSARLFLQAGPVASLAPGLRPGGCRDVRGAGAQASHSSAFSGAGFAARDFDERRERLAAGRVACSSRK